MDESFEAQRVSYQRGDIYWMTAFNVYQNSLSYYIRVEQGEMGYYLKWKASLRGLFSIIKSFYSKINQRKIKLALNNAQIYINNKQYKKAYPILNDLQNRFGELITQKSIQTKDRLKGLGGMKHETLGYDRK